MTDRVAIRRLATGVPGLDQILGGGLPEFSFDLIAGAPGAGKTTLAQQIMFALSQPLAHTEPRSQFHGSQDADHEGAWTGAHSRAAYLPYHRRRCSGVPPGHRQGRAEVPTGSGRREAKTPGTALARHQGVGRHARRWHPRRLFGAARGTVRLGQERAGHALHQRGRAQRRPRHHRGVRKAPRRVLAGGSRRAAVRPARSRRQGGRWPRRSNSGQMWSCSTSACRS